MAEAALAADLDNAWPSHDPLLADPSFSDDVDAGDLPHGPGPLPSTPDHDELRGNEGTTTSSVAPLGVAKVCGVDEESVKQPLEMEWTEPASPADWDAVTTARSETYLQFFNRRSADWLEVHPASVADTEPLGLALEERVAWVAAKLRLTVPEFMYAVNGDLRHLDRFAALAVQEDNESPLEGMADPSDAAAFAPLPFVSDPAHRTAPAAYVDPARTIDLHPLFAGTFTFYAMFKDPDWAREQYETWRDRTVADASKAFKALREGRTARSPTRPPLVFLPEHFHDCLVGRSINCENHDACFVTSDSDRESRYFTPEGKLADTIKHDRVAADLGPAFPDQEFVHELRYGHDSKSKQPWCLVLCSMNASAAADLGVVAKAIDAGIAKGWQSEATHITAVPAVYEPFGIAYKRHSVDRKTKKPKARLTTDKSGPRNTTTADGQPIADNENIDLEDHPATRLPRVGELRQALETLGAIVRTITPQVRAEAASPAEADRAAEALQVDMGSDDFQGYFSQFCVRHKSIQRQGIILPREDNSLTFSFSRRVQFGGKASPAFAMRMTGAVLHRLGVLMAADEARFTADAEAYELDASTGSAIAARVAPRPLRRLLAERGQRGLDARPYWAAGYIDDMFLCAIGRVRGIAYMHNLWSIAEDWGLPIALDKSQYGQDMSIIGYRFLTRSNKFMLLPTKVHLLQHWIARLRALRGHKVQVAELASLAGQLVWARTALPLAGKFIRRIFSLANRPEQAIYQPNWLHHDLEAISDVLDSDNGTMMIGRPALPGISHPTSVAWSDACRETDGSISGAGGFSPKGGGLLWSYKFSQYHKDHLPIHVLEAVAEVVGLALVAEATAADANDPGRATCLQFCDNMSWVSSVAHGKPTDPRLREILQIRHDLQDRFGIDAKIAYVNTKVNIVADAVSRDDLPAALEELRLHHWNIGRIRVVDLNEHPELGPPDLELLLDRAVQLTLAREKAARGNRNRPKRKGKGRRGRR